jgi:hypothetical protein
MSQLTQRTKIYKSLEKALILMMMDNDMYGSKKSPYKIVYAGNSQSIPFSITPMLMSMLKGRNGKTKITIIVEDVEETE